MVDLIRFRQLRVKIFGVPFGQFFDRVDPGLFQQLGILPSNTVNPEEICLINPSQKQVMKTRFRPLGVAAWSRNASTL